MKLQIRSVGKRYRRGIWGIRDFSLDAGPGIIGLLGPNGAGKTTLMNILATVTKPTTGSVFWNETDVLRYPNSLRARLGYLPQDFGVYPNLNALELLTYLAALKGVGGRSAGAWIQELLELVNLFDVRDRRLVTYSGGMRQRLGIAQALLNNPRLLLLDEPTAGLDPAERVRFRNLMVELAENRLVVLSTHIVSDIEAIASRIVLVSEGHKLMDASAETLLREAEGKVWEGLIPSHELAVVQGSYPVSSTRHTAEGVIVRFVSEVPPGGAARPVSPNLEEAYLYLVSERRSNP